MSSLFSTPHNIDKLIIQTQLLAQKSAQEFPDQSFAAPAPNYAQLCHHFLTTLQEQREQYQKAVSTCTPFATEFCSLLQENCTEENIFSLFECLTIFSRERVLRQPLTAEFPAEKALFTQFTQSGEWSFGDGTLVTDWFYVRIPLLLMQECSKNILPTKNSMSNHNTSPLVKRPPFFSRHTA